jgi:hypothetical protein
MRCSKLIVPLWKGRTHAARVRQAELDQRPYPTGIEVLDAELAAVV